jgi:plastocyanin
MLLVTAAALAVASCDGGGNGGGYGGPTAPPPPTGPGTTTIQMTGASNFTPANVTVSAGDTVRWVNSSGLTHTTTSGMCCTGNGTWNSGNMGNGAQFRVVFGPGTNGPGIVHVDATGSFPYFCIPHGAMMTGTVTVNP